MDDRNRLIPCLIPPRHDFLCATVVEGLDQLGYAACCTELTNNARRDFLLTASSIVSTCQQAAFILVFSNRGYDSRRQFLLERGWQSKSVYLDGSDGRHLEDPEAPAHYALCFKHEMFGQTHPRVRPLPLAAETAYFQCKVDQTKDIEISCTLRPHSPARRAVVETVAGLGIGHCLVGPVSDGGPAEPAQSQRKAAYFDVLARSRISVAYPGDGFDTGRFWEILANRALLFSPPVALTMPHPFIEGEHFIPYHNMRELHDELLHYSRHQAQAESIARAGHAHLLAHHTSRERARYMIQTIHDVLGLSG